MRTPNDKPTQPKAKSRTKKETEKLIEKLKEEGKTGEICWDKGCRVHVEG